MITQKDLGERIAKARVRSGFTQEQVAGSLKVPRTAITQIENGNRQVSSLELFQLGQLFGIEVKDLLEGTDPNEELLTLFRKKENDQDSGVEVALRETLPICRVVSDLEDIIDEHEGKAPTWDTYHYSPKALHGSPRSQGQELAELERERLQLGNGAIPDLMFLVLRSGIIVVEHDLPQDVSGIYLRMKNGRSFIILRQQESYSRKRFSLAHEYCHSLMDSHELIIVSRENLQSNIEIRANYFASSFLLPKEGIIHFTSENKLIGTNVNFTHVAQLAVKFGMSYEATIVALDQAGYMTKEKKTELQDAVRNAKGYMLGSLNYGEPQFNRTTLREWAFYKTIKALELDIISLRKAISISKQLGYEEEVVRENFAQLSKEDGE
ncbi:MAG: XRE family transcriptional regulator [Thermoplasmatales archaeon]|jgi:Zn-dependent peptidase ImmA (M78 family)/DNA-binding XRE family transcriptional regulator|nr:XRE family transcriptional regulator [Thermoplasmatales archaeon]